MKRSNKRRQNEHSLLRPLAAEQLLIDYIPKIHELRILCTSPGRAQFAAAVAGNFSRAQVICHYLDVFEADQARDFHHGGPDNLIIEAAADFPIGEFDLVAVPVGTNSDAELTRDILQSGHMSLQLGGRMVAATRNGDDTWLHREMRKLFPKVTREEVDRGVLYLATKTVALKKVKDFECEFAFRDKGRLIKAVSRPGVFSHRSLDAGARALLNTMVVNPGDRVLDIGCGSGAVALAAAFRAKGTTVLAMDSCSRAIQCTLKGAALNKLKNVTGRLNAEGDCGETGTFDMVAGNPPYFSDYRIAEVFLQAAKKALKPGGQVFMVSKASIWFVQRMQKFFDDVEPIEHKTYVIVKGTQRDECGVYSSRSAR